MKEFNKFNWSSLKEDELVLMTCEFLSPRQEMKIADFRDVDALKFRKTGNWIGMSPLRGLRLGNHDLRMVDGNWICTEDYKMSYLNKDMDLSPDLLVLDVIC